MTCIWRQICSQGEEGVRERRFLVYSLHGRLAGVAALRGREHLIRTWSEEEVHELLKHVTEVADSGPWNCCFSLLSIASGILKLPRIVCQLPPKDVGVWRAHQGLLVVSVEGERRGKLCYLPWYMVLSYLLNRSLLAHTRKRTLRWADFATFCPCHGCLPGAAFCC